MEQARSSTSLVAVGDGAAQTGLDASTGGRPPEFDLSWHLSRHGTYGLYRGEGGGISRLQTGSFARGFRRLLIATGVRQSARSAAGDRRAGVARRLRQPGQSDVGAGERATAGNRRETGARGDAGPARAAVADREHVAGRAGRRRRRVGG